MSARELERWLCDPAAPEPSPDDLACVFGLCFDAPGSGREGGTPGQRLRFTLAVLRDVFPTDAGVRRWLCAPHADRGGDRPLDLVLGGRAAELEELEALAVREWNRRLGVLAPTVVLLRPRLGRAGAVHEPGAPSA